MCMMPGHMFKWATATLHARGVDGAPIGAESGGLCVRRWAHHKEFVTGIDFNLFVQGQVACVHIYTHVSSFLCPSTYRHIHEY